MQQQDTIEENFYLSLNSRCVTIVHPQQPLDKGTSMHLYFSRVNMLWWFCTTSILTFAWTIIFNFWWFSATSRWILSNAKSVFCIWLCFPITNDIGAYLILCCINFVTLFFSQEQQDYARKWIIHIGDGISKAPHFLTRKSYLIIGHVVNE